MTHTDRMACRTCRRELPRRAFYQNADGGWIRECKECKRAAVRVNRAARREHYLGYERARSRTGERIAAIAESRKRYPEHQRARRVIQNAVHRGNLVKPDACTECALPAPLDGHHEDYNRPHDVVWLCRSCHMKRHRFDARGMP